ncbi:MAG TPA: sialidase family protein [Longimicrobiaceae bacterium]|nr:sialidase family protein [Longimicrobiaceae bacterium]
MRLPALAALLVAGCSAAVQPTGSAAPVTRAAPYSAATRVAWDGATLRRLYDGPASYPRMIRLRSGALLCSFESAGASLVIRSDDDGTTWSAPVVAAAREGGVAAAVPSLLQLRSGTVLLAYNPRPPADNRDPSRHFAIRVEASEDGGRTWSDRATVFQAGYEWGRGIWEPAMVQLPSGEIQLFAANEWPHAQDDDQEISRFRSWDDGRSWSAPERVSYRAGHRDGMPVPLLLKDGGLVVAIEDDGLVAGPFKPVLLRLPGDGSALDEPISGASPARRAALADGARLPVGAYAGAPYLAQFPTGETLLSFQSNAGRGGEWTNSTMVVAVGDRDAGDFGRATRPFPVPNGRRALWGSLFVRDSSTVTALTTTNAFDPARQELWAIDGRRIATPQE